MGQGHSIDSEGYLSQQCPTTHEEYSLLGSGELVCKPNGKQATAIYQYGFQVAVCEGPRILSSCDLIKAWMDPGSCLRSCRSRRTINGSGQLKRSRRAASHCEVDGAQWRFK
jgi:hypothetical protein